MAFSTRTRRAVTTVLALVLAVETVTAVAAAAATSSVTHPLPVEPPAGVVLAAEAGSEPAAAPAVAALPAVAWFDDAPDFAKPRTVPVVAAEPAGPTKAQLRKERERARQERAERRERAAQRERAAAARAQDRADRSKAERSAGRDRDRSPSYRGTNHVWIPQLGINRSVRWFPCDRERPPDNYMYRWGCAGANNVYLMGHAYSVMDPLHDAYVNGSLRKGMKAWYADGNGKVRVYAVKWWKVTLPTTDAAWAWAAQSRPSMTLQTCVGKNSKYRLMVRLVQVDG